MHRIRPRLAASARLTVPALVVILSLGGFVAASRIVARDRQAAAARRADAQSIRAEELLSRARSYMVGLANALAGERRRDARRFLDLQGNGAASVGLTDVLWIERVPAAGRAAYERRLGRPITRLSAAGGYRRAPAAGAYFPATFVTNGQRPHVRPGVDVSAWPGLSAELRDLSTLYAVTASSPGGFGDVPGFYLVDAARYGPGAAGRGFLAVFVPRGWLTLGLGADPRQVSISMDRWRLEGRRQTAPDATSAFDALGRHWRIATAAGAATPLQAAIPWVALAWPFTVAALIYALGSGIVRRRRAEQEVERIFDLSLDMLGVAGADGYFRRINPAFERTLGYTREQLLSRPLLAFVHPDDRAATSAMMDALARGHEPARFENRYLRADGSVCWLEWSARPAPAEDVIYAAARDVTAGRRMQDQQAALRRVATLVARGGPPAEVLDAVVEELGRLVEADATTLMRSEADGTATTVSIHGAPPATAVGAPASAAGQGLMELVRHAGGAVRVDDAALASDPAAARLREAGVTTAVAVPVVVDGRPWGAMVAVWRGDEPVAADVEGRMVQFGELVATAIANAEGRAQLAASRARVVAASDETRRRIERDLHDGAQQRLVALALALRSAEASVPPEQGDLRDELAHAADGLTDVLEDLQEMSRGIHPAVVSKGGLAPALKTLARRSPIPVELRLEVAGRLPEPAEVAAYYVASEALANAAKHAHASAVRLEAAHHDGVLSLVVADDGIGGAEPGRGSGLVGLGDRVEALGGRIEIDSRPGGGTTLRATIPVGEPAH